MQPVVADLQKKCFKDIDFIYLDTDKRATQAASRRYGVYAIPNFVLLDASGNVIKRWVGSVPASEFETVEKYCSK